MGPLAGVKIIELAGIGPGPFCGMMLSDMGAEVIRVDRYTENPQPSKDVLNRNRQSIAVDLKQPEGVETVLKLVCLLYTSPSPRDQRGSRMPSSA